MDSLQSGSWLSHRKIGTGNTGRRNISEITGKTNKHFSDLPWNGIWIFINEISF